MQAALNIAAAHRGSSKVEHLTSDETAGYLAIAYIFQSSVKERTGQ